jgi:hypothetical protein
MTLAVVTTLALLTASLLAGTRTFLRREQTAWSAAVAFADAHSAEVWWLGSVRRNTSITCLELAAAPAPPLDNGSSIELDCHQVAPGSWTITVSAIHGPRRATLTTTVASNSSQAWATVEVQARSVVTEPNPARTSAA